MSLIILKSSGASTTGLSELAIVGLLVFIAALYLYSKKSTAKKDR